MILDARNLPVRPSIALALCDRGDWPCPLDQYGQREYWVERQTGMVHNVKTITVTLTTTTPELFRPTDATPSNMPKSFGKKLFRPDRLIGAHVFYRWREIAIP